MTPGVSCETHHAGLTVPDIGAAVDYYTAKLGFTLGFTWGEPPRFAGMNLDQVQIFLQQGTPNPTGSTVYFVVGAVDELYEFHRANGVEIVEEPEDQEYGMRTCLIRDLNGYALSFGQYIYNAGPALEIERVDFPVRIEKRLAALMADLAERKHMTLSSCLEEILLHTCEPLGDGVASPHTKADLRYIEELKKKHGIDYDSHASYRFREK